jgi:hypothetical protein
MAQVCILCIDEYDILYTGRYDTGTVRYVFKDIAIALKEGATDGRDRCNLFLR